MQSAIMLGIGILGYLMKEDKKNTNKDICQNKEEIAEVEKKLTEKIDKVDNKVETFKDHVNRNFVDKESYIRNITSFDNKLDKITDLIMEMKGEKRQ
jgi:hypothetical protein